MVYLFWALLNMALFIAFIVVCFKATRFIREKIGWAASFLFVIGLFAFIGGSNRDKDNLEPNSNQIKTWKFTSSSSLDKSSGYSVKINLEETLISKYTLGIQYGKDTGHNNIPTSANTWTTGFESGMSWKPTSIIVNRTDDNHKFEYEVYGTVKWSLLGLTIYHQPKYWTGEALLQ